MMEVIATTLEDAIAINRSGADRIELIKSFNEGGLTPDYTLMKEVIELVDIPVNVMIRPHSHSFCYHDHEIEGMIKDIKMVQAFGGNGIVIGVLDKNRRVDLDCLHKLLLHAENLEVTFHRAIDESSDLMSDMKRVCSLSKITTILTSGGPGKANDHVDRLIEMKKIALHYNKVLLLGSGINENNMVPLLKAVGSNEVHIGSAVRIENDPRLSIDILKLNKIVHSYKHR